MVIWAVLFFLFNGMWVEVKDSFNVWWWLCSFDSARVCINVSLSYVLLWFEILRSLCARVGGRFCGVRKFWIWIKFRSGLTFWLQLFLFSLFLGMDLSGLGRLRKVGSAKLLSYILLSLISIDPIWLFVILVL